jgi:DNA repair exonuclease SbcCD ATPase subunit
VLKERMRAEREERRMRSELESEVQKKTAYLTRAIEELQAEIDERKRMEAEVETTHWELRAVSSKAGMARIATSVLESVGEMLKSVNVSTSLVSDHVKRSKIANVVHVGILIREHAADLGKFIAHDPRGQKLPVYIAQLAEHLATEQASLLNELASLKMNLEKVMAMQQDYAQFAGATDQASVAAMFEGALAQRGGQFTSRRAETDLLEVKS